MLLAKLFLATLSLAAGNGNVVGNGGNSVICPPPVSSAEIFQRGVASLDLVEGKTFRHYHYSKLASLRGLSLEAAFARAVNLFLPAWSYERPRVQQRFARRAGEIRWVNGPVQDLHIFSPQIEAMGCRLQQVAVQYGAPQPTLNDRLGLDISLPVWKTMPVDQQVALLFHEFLLKDRLFQQGACAVNNVRELVAYVLSDESRTESVSDWRWFTERDCHFDPERDQGGHF